MLSLLTNKRFIFIFFLNVYLFITQLRNKFKKIHYLQNTHIFKFLVKFILNGKIINNLRSFKEKNYLQS